MNRPARWSSIARMSRVVVALESSPHARPFTETPDRKADPAFLKLTPNALTNVSSANVVSRTARAPTDETGGTRDQATIHDPVTTRRRFQTQSSPTLTETESDYFYDKIGNVLFEVVASNDEPM